MATRNKRFSNHKFTLLLKPWDTGCVDLSWSVVCKDGAVALNCGSWRDSDKTIQWSCGIEFHRRVPTGDEAPTFVKCYLLNGFCWHEGSSTQASEFWHQEGGLRFYQSGDHDYIFKHLEYALTRFFESKETE